MLEYVLNQQAHIFESMAADHSTAVTPPGGQFTYPFIHSKLWLLLIKTSTQLSQAFNLTGTVVGL